MGGDLPPSVKKGSNTDLVWNWSRPGVPGDVLVGALKTQVAMGWQSVEFSFLGPLEVTVDAARLPLGGEKVRLTLAVLLEAEGRSVALEKLSGILADRRSSSRAVRDPQGAVHSCVSDLRGILRQGGLDADALIPKREPGYRLVVARDNVDLHRFRERAREVRRLAARNRAEDDPRIVHVARAALGQWDRGGAGPRGEPLADLTGRWATECRNNLRREHREITVRCLEAELRLGAGARLVAELEALHREWPFEEAIVGMLMLAHDRAGHRLQALRVYEGFERRVGAKFGTGPSPETKNLFRRIVEEDATLHPPVRTARKGTAMPPHRNPALAQRMADALAPVLPVLTGAGDPDPEARLNGASFDIAKDLWVLINRRSAVSLLPEATRERPDRAVLRAQLEEVLAADDFMSAEASRVLDETNVRGMNGQIIVSGNYFHQGDVINGTSIKNYGS
ncbi:AfsR/SARP family transcriptional regulator [Actinomadura rayongensis]|uniref:Bacterial transcriptional activator domain-containing protein n=1 Tax=Actinomadura rayongensis TaxID=1429076 RepID=A0A6I4W9W1_9ACTN|nr:bacterial transcriptional activator domain-containing protein [Actinomadura rayongensis]MXQ65963.1 hypothetical protein [Actinomadura rayongensis]